MPYKQCLNYDILITYINTSLALPFATHLSKEGYCSYNVCIEYTCTYTLQVTHSYTESHTRSFVHYCTYYMHMRIHVVSTHHTHIHFLMLQSYHQSHSDVRVYDCSWLWQRSNKQGKRLRVSAYVIITILACMNCLVYHDSFGMGNYIRK